MLTGCVIPFTERANDGGSSALRSGDQEGMGAVAGATVLLNVCIQRDPYLQERGGIRMGLQASQANEPREQTNLGRSYGSA